ncbi:MAG TPA: hypothetical protein VF484_03485 [Candidatus Limnocylindrales bacterium]
MTTGIEATARPGSRGPAATHPVVEWLLEPSHPVVRRLALLGLEGRPSTDSEMAALTASLTNDPWVAPLLAGRFREGVEPPTFVHAYAKWTGAHWRLFALAELGLDRTVPGARRSLEGAVEQELEWLLSPGRRRRLRPIDGRTRNCSSQEGAGVWAAVRLGFAAEPRLRPLVERLVEIQWPDGGWNCDVRPAASHSSFNESWMPLRALVAYRAADATLEDPVEGLDEAIERAVEFFLRHRVVESERTGGLANERVALLRWPPYWHYGLLPGLRTLADAGRLDDPRARAGLERLRERRAADGRWYPEGRYWRGPGAAAGAGVELVRWGRDGEAKMLTLHAMQLLRAAGLD